MARTADDRGPYRHAQRIGRYELVERIGRGAMSVVYRARDEVMGREVALKILDGGPGDDTRQRARFERESDAAANLSHPNIVTVYDVGADADRFYIVMELLRGATLTAFLEQPHASPIDCRIDLMMQLSAGLSAAHTASIHHRDIKPGNIFVRTDGILKILDFGVSRRAGSSAIAPGSIVGTPDYMSPEQARGGEIDARSDIFSAGGVFYFMLTNRKPFPGADLPTLFHQIQHHEPRPIESGHPADLVALVMKTLAKSADDRYQSCQDVLAALEAIKERRARLAGAAPTGSSAPAAAGDSATRKR